MSCPFCPHCIAAGAAGRKKFAPRSLRPWPYEGTYPPGPVTVYALVDWRDDTIRYIGHSANMKQRMSLHGCVSGAVNKLVREWVRTFPDERKKPDFEVLGTCSAEAAPYLEDMWIRAFLAEHDLLNVKTTPPDSHRRPKLSFT